MAEDRRSLTDPGRTWCGVVRVLAVLWLGLNGIVMLHAGGIALLVLWFTGSEAWARGVLGAARTPLLVLPLNFAVVMVAIPLMAQRRERVWSGRFLAVASALRVGLLPWIVASVSSAGYCLAVHRLGVASPGSALLAVAWIAFGLGVLNIVVAALLNQSDKRRC